MTNISDELIQKLVSEKKYETIQEFASVTHMGQKPICFHEYNGTEIRAFEQDGNINVLYPEHPTAIQESALAKAISTGSIFDDAEEVSRGAKYINFIILPSRAFGMSNSVSPPKQLMTLTKACIGQMDDQGRLPCSQACIDNGYNFQKDMFQAGMTGHDHADIVRHHLGIPDSEDHLPKCLAADSYACHKGLEKLKPFNPEDTLDKDDYEEIDPTAEAAEIVEDIEKSKLEEDNEKLPTDTSDGEKEEDISVDDPEDSKDEDEDSDDDDAEEADIDDEDDDEDEDDEEDDDEEDDDEEDDDEESEESETVQEFVVTLPANIRKKMTKICKVIVSDLNKVIDLYESDRLSRGKVINLYGSKTIKSSSTIKVSDSYSVERPNEYDLKSGEMMYLYQCRDYCRAITGKKKYSKKFSHDELNAISKVEKCVSDIIEDLESIISDPEGYDKLIKNVIKNGKETINAITAMTRGFEASMNAKEDEVVSESETIEEGFISKRPKKLKPLKARETVSYITVELNAIRDANDQAMLSGYICSKLELVDFYINCLDTQDDRYVVPHNRAYLVQFQTDLNRLLTQVLAIKPINKQDRIWQVNVNYPEGWRV